MNKGFDSAQPDTFLSHQMNIGDLLLFIRWLYEQGFDSAQPDNF
jgi:hypothetical protein